MRSVAGALDHRRLRCDAVILLIASLRDDGDPLGMRHKADDVRHADGQLVLVVDDNPLNRMVLSEMLDRAGFNVIEARDGVEAISLASRRRPSLILMDLSMPRMTGIDALREMRCGDAAARTPIVAVTADTSTANREVCADAGFDDFVAKPVDMTDLIDTVRRLTS